MEEKFITIVNSVCPGCGYRNKTKQVTSEKVVIVACGSCGRILKQMEDIPEEEMPMIKKMLDRVVGGEEDVLL